MRRIWKISVAVGRHPHAFDLPRAAKVLHVACQDAIDEVQVWFEIDDERGVEERTFGVFGTGSAVKGVHVGTALTANGALVWHVYELEPRTYRG